MRSRFDKQLDELNRELIEMGALCESAIAMAQKALETGDSTLAAEVVSFDTEIDHKERSVETMCLRMLLQQQPVARDLRQISAALKMITDMERIGDQAADIAEMLKFVSGYKGGESKTISEMAKVTIEMVTKSIDAYVKQDVALAKGVIEQDDIVDRYFEKVKESLIKLLENKSLEGEYAIDLMMIAKYFERIGDHATNIAEWVEFSVTGVHKGKVEL